MSWRKSRRGRRSRRQSRRGNIKRSFAALLAHPLRTVFIGFASATLAWLVLTKSLPYALAPTNPDLALRLNPDNPIALLAKAERARAALLAIVTRAAAAAKTRRRADGRQRSTAPGPAGTKAHPSQTALPEFSSPEARNVERQRLRKKIRTTARHIIRVDPLNATAYRLLGEVTDDPQRVRVLMQQAVRRSRHESAALFWLLNDAFAGKDFPAALNYADWLLLTRPALTRYVMAYLAEIARVPAGRALVVDRLATAPKWRGAFIRALSAGVGREKQVLELMNRLKRTANPLTARELSPYIHALIGKRKVYEAYNVWLQLLPEAQLVSLGFLTNGEFESNPSGLPFDWQTGRPRNATFEFSPRPDGETGRALHLLLGPGRVTFPSIRQTIILAPGPYRLQVSYRGSIRGKRGLRWRVSCLFGRRQIIAQTDMLRGVVKKWRPIDLEFTVPDAPGCQAQQLSLIHDARSASEELVSGEAWFDDLKLRRRNN